MQLTENAVEKRTIAIRPEQTKAALTLKAQVDELTHMLNGYLFGLLQEYDADGGRFAFSPDMTELIEQ